MATPRSSKSRDDEKSSPVDSESAAPKRRPAARKPAAAPKGSGIGARGRKKTAKASETEAGSAPAETPELPLRDEPAAREEARETPPSGEARSESRSYHESRDERPARAPHEDRDEIPAGHSFSFSPDDAPPADQPVVRGEATPSRVEETPSGEHFTPAGDSGPASAPSGAPAHGPGNGGQPVKRFGKEYWKQLKLEKKRQKMLQRQQSGGAHPGNHGGGGGGGGERPHHGGGGQQHREDRPDRPERPERPHHGKKHGRHERERGPQQPPPPNFVTVHGDLPPPDRFAELAALETLAVDLASGGGEPLELNKLSPLSFAELTAFARAQGVSFEGVPNRHQATMALLKHAAAAKRPILDRGWLDLTDRGHGFIVHSHDNYRLYPDDTYLPESLVKTYGLKRGVELEVQVQPPAEGERCPSVVKVRTVMGDAPEAFQKLVPFEELVPYYPLKRILLENHESENQKDVSMRLVDIVTPIGFGQRGLIVAPPRTGKTVILHSLANSISANFPEVKLIILLVDERPEEVTDFKRHTKGEVVSSTFDETPESHVHAAEMVIERSRRLIEKGEHVVILLDSITRLARAYNTLAANSGKIMSGGIEASALQKPKRFFGSARNIEGGGSLTIVGTALVDTGSKMDEVIFEEFKGTGNMELHLDRDLVNKRIFPAVNVDKSGTRKEELIYHPDELQRIFSLRRTMQGIPPTEAMFMFIDRLKKTKTNVEFLMGLNR